jgi:tetratricopeptide (TPR) repeat protein
MSVRETLRTHMLGAIACSIALAISANVVGQEDARVLAERESQVRATVAYGRELRLKLIYPALIAGRFETAAEHAEIVRREYAKLPEPHTWLATVSERLVEDVERIRTTDEETQRRIRGAFDERLKAEEFLSKDDASRTLLALTKARNILTADLPNSLALEEVLHMLLDYLVGCECDFEPPAVAKELCDLRTAVLGRQHFLTLEAELQRSCFRSDQPSIEEVNRCLSASLAAIKPKFGENSQRCFETKVLAAFAYAKLNDPKRAEAALTEVLGKRPSSNSENYSSAWVLLAEAQVALKKFADAERTIATVKELDDNNQITNHLRRRYYQAKADVLRHQDQTEVAKIYQQMADKVANEIAADREEFRAAVKQLDAAK